MFLFFNVVCCARQIEGKKPRRWLRLPDLGNGGSQWWTGLDFHGLSMDSNGGNHHIHHYSPILWPFYGHGENDDYRTPPLVVPAVQGLCS